MRTKIQKAQPLILNQVSELTVKRELGQKQKCSYWYYPEWILLEVYVVLLLKYNY